MASRQHAAKPKGFGGKRVLNKMNTGVHAELSKWGLSHLKLTDYKEILDVGCGGGANIAALLEGSPEAHVTGVDYSDVSVKTSRKENAKEIKKGRCAVQQENVKDLSFADAAFDLVTAFETIYFWPDIADSFAQVFRVLEDGGTFFICNETDGEDPEGYEWQKDIKGLTIYTEDEIIDLLKQAGFALVEKDKDPWTHWIVFIARKSNC